jgi:hypothetical protein
VRLEMVDVRMVADCFFPGFVSLHGGFGK